MAEFVELRLEEMLPELEQMKRVQMFSEQEIKALVKKRRDFEYKLQKRTKVKEDFLKYIQYEINLLTLVRVRREKIGYHFKKPEIDHAIANRINKLFFFATARFPTDLKLWLSHIEFCKRMRWRSSISRIFVRLLAIKSGEPSLWVMAAKWEFEDNGSVGNARGLLLRALRFHPGSIQLYSEAFRLELLEADRLRKRREVLGLSCEAELPDGEEEKDSILDGQLAVLFYNEFREKVQQCAADALPFLVIAKDFDFTRELQQIIITHMKETYSEDEVTWDTVARGLLENSESKLKDRVRLCCESYGEAIERLNTPKMWQMYVETLFELYTNDYIKPRIRLQLHDACYRALSGRHLLESHILNWVELFEDSSTAAGYSLKTILEESLQQFPKNATLWTKLLKMLLEGKEEEPLFLIDNQAEADSPTESPSPPTEIPDKFWLAVNTLGSSVSALPIWEMVIDHFRDVGDLVESLYAKALATEVPVGTHFRPRYLNWMASAKGLAEARKFYRAQAVQPPLVLEFHYQMMDLELNAGDVHVGEVRQVLDNATLQFGQKDPGIWLRYIQFELEHGDATRVGNLHYRAKLTLEPTLTDQFLTQYTLLQLQA